MSYKLYKINKDKTRVFEIENVKMPEWADNIKDVFTSFGFTSTTSLNKGDNIELYNVNDDTTVFYGVIIDTNQSSKGEFEYNGYDCGFYLTKNELTTQYKQNSFEYVFKDVCQKCNLSTGEIPKFNKSEYTHIYRKTIAENILKDSYANVVKNGEKDVYFFDCKDGKINLRQYNSIQNLKGYISLFGTIDSLTYIKNFNINETIADLKNQVEVFTDDSVNKKNTDKPDGIAKDENSIEKYGLLKTTEDLDKDSTQSAQTVANDTLKRLNTIRKTIELTLWGDYKLQKGVIIPIDNEIIGLKGEYKVLSSKHRINKIDEEITITLEKV